MLATAVFRLRRGLRPDAGLSLRLPPRQSFICGAACDRTPVCRYTCHRD